MANLYSTQLVGASSQYWNITDASQSGLDFSGDMSISMWVKMASAPGSGSSMYLVSKFPSIAGQFSYRFVYQNNAGNLRLLFGISSDGTATDNSTSNNYTLTLNTWFQIGVTKSGTTVTYYVNGAAIGTATNLSGSSIFNGTADFSIGRNIDAAFNGEVDDVIIYNTAISGANMATNYSTPCIPYTTGAVSRWKFDNNAFDSIGGANTLTGVNSPTFTSDTPYTCIDSSFFYMT